tara:strand:+ start:294 stop:1121 length:828 start_codon:yes stop_codon:yes gene_type:complete
VSSKAFAQQAEREIIGMQSEKRSTWCVGAAVLGLALLIVGGCDQSAANDQAKMDQMQKQMDDIRSDLNEDMQSQLAEDGIFAADEDYIDSMASVIEDAAANTSPEQAKVLQRQAGLLRELEAIMAPYNTALTDFMELGGIDPVTITELGHFDVRFDLIDRMAVANESMDTKIPRLIRQLGNIEGRSLVTTQQQVDLLTQMRESDRVLFEGMTRYLTLLKNNWNLYELETATGMLMFAESVPDETIDEINLALEVITEQGVKQGQIQQAILDLDQP